MHPAIEPHADLLVTAADPKAPTMLERPRRVLVRWHTYGGDAVELTLDLRRGVALGAYGGLRVTEAAGLHWRDIDQDARRMIVRGKGDKERPVGLSTRLLDVLLPDTGGNVVTGEAEGYDPHYFQMKVNAAIRAAGVDATFHKLRHRFGHMAASAGVPVTSLARAMGHESLTTTMGYVAAVDSDLDVIAEAVARVEVPRNSPPAPH